MKVDIYQMKGEEPHLIFVKSGESLGQLVPKSVYDDLMKWKLVRHMNLSPSTTLVGVTASEIIDQIKENGYFATGSSIKGTGGTGTTSTFGAGLGAGILAASLGLTPLVSVIAGLVAGLLVNVSNSKEK